MPAPPHETAALARALGAQFSPELLFGIGGGTGFGWFTYGDHSTLLTRITTRETPQQSFLLDICVRLGVDARLAGVTSTPALRKRINSALAARETVLVATGGPGASYSATLVERLDDDVLTKAAELPGAARNRFLTIRGLPRVGAARRREAIQAGLRAHVEQMRAGFGPPSARGSFGLAGYERWRRSATSFDADARARLHAQINDRGGGPALRLAHAAFLEEAGLKNAAALTRRAAQAWSAVGVDPTIAHITAVEEAERAALDAIESHPEGAAK